MWFQGASTSIHCIWCKNAKGIFRDHDWKRLEAAKRDARLRTAKKAMIGSGTSAPLEIRTSTNAATSSKKPKAHENKSFWAVDLGLLWHIKMVTPMNTHPAPMFFWSATAAFSTVSLPAISGNIARVKNTGSPQNATSSSTIRMPLIANMSLELPIKYFKHIYP